MPSFHGEGALPCPHCGTYHFAHSLHIHVRGCRDKAAAEAQAGAVSSTTASCTAEEREARRLREHAQRARATLHARRIAAEATRHAEKHDVACARAARLRNEKARWPESEEQRAARKASASAGLGDHTVAARWTAGMLAHDRGARKFQGVKARPGLLQLDRQALLLDAVYVGHRKDGAFHMTNRAGSDVYVQLNMPIALHRRYRVAVADCHGASQLQGEPGGERQQWPTPWARVANGATVRVAVALRVPNKELQSCVLGPEGHMDEISINVSLSPNGHDGGAQRVQKMPIVIHFRSNDSLVKIDAAPPHRVVLKHCFAAAVTEVDDPCVQPEGDEKVMWRHGHACMSRGVARRQPERPATAGGRVGRHLRRDRGGLCIPTATHTQNGASRNRRAPVQFGAQRRGLARSTGGRFFDT